MAEKVREIGDKIISGDTFTTDTGRVVKLAGVDAALPGKRGHFEGKGALKRLVHGHIAFIEIFEKDEEGRDVAQVKVQGAIVNDVMKKYSRT